MFQSKAQFLFSSLRAQNEQRCDFKPSVDRSAVRLSSGNKPQRDRDGCSGSEPAQRAAETLDTFSCLHRSKCCNHTSEKIHWKITLSRCHVPCVVIIFYRKIRFGMNFSCFHAMLSECGSSEHPADCRKTEEEKQENCGKNSNRVKVTLVLSEQLFKEHRTQSIMGKHSPYHRRNVQVRTESGDSQSVRQTDSQSVRRV